MMARHYVAGEDVGTEGMALRQLTSTAESFPDREAGRTGECSGRPLVGPDAASLGQVAGIVAQAATLR